MRKKTVQTATMLAVILILMVVNSCGDNKNSINKQKTMKLDECGLEMNIPSGWKLDSPLMCSKGDATGIFDFESLNGKTFERAAEEMSVEFGSKIISKNEAKVAEKKALKVYIDANEHEMKVLRMYIDCGDKIAYISYAVPKDDFASFEPELLKSIDSLRNR